MTRDEVKLINISLYLLLNEVNSFAFQVLLLES